MCVSSAMRQLDGGGRVLVVFVFVFYLLTRLSSPTFGRKKLYNIHLGLTLWADCKLAAAATILFSLSNVKWLLQKPSLMLSGRINKTALGVGIIHRVGAIYFWLSIMGNPAGLVLVSLFIYHMHRRAVYSFKRMAVRES